MLDRAFRHVVEHLVAGRSAGDRRHFLKIGDVKIADSPGTDLPFPLQTGEGRHGLGQRIAATPVQQVAIQVIGAQVLKTLFAGQHRTALGGIARKHLGDQKDLGTSSLDRLADHLLRGARTVHFGRIDVR